jgi:hypothetical protein
MNEKEYSQTIIIPKFIEKVEISKHRRAKYYKSTDRLPMKYKKDEYVFKNGILINVDTGEKIIKNSRSVGKPNYIRITGQIFYSGINFNLRRKIKKEMANFFAPYLGQFKRIKKEQYPIGVRIDLYDSMDFKGSQQDLDNFIYPYRKVIHDVLTGKDPECKKVIEDDSKEYIQDIPTRFYPIDNHEDRKLVIEIYSLK